MSKIIAVDVDLTVVDSLKPWMDWFKAETGKLPQNLGKAYDLVPEMREIVRDLGMDLDPFSFWQKGDLYDGLEPLEGARKYISALRDEGSKIIFVSLCVPGHTDSKVRFLDRYFGYDGFISTGDKHFVGYDAIIDDRAYHINTGLEYRPEAAHIHFQGIHRGTDGSDVHSKAYTSKSWEENYNILKWH